MQACEPARNGETAIERVNRQLDDIGLKAVYQQCEIVLIIHRCPNAFRHISRSRLVERINKMLPAGFCEIAGPMDKNAMDTRCLQTFERGRKRSEDCFCVM